MRKDIVEALAGMHGLDSDIVLAPDDPDEYEKIPDIQFHGVLDANGAQQMYSLIQQAREQALTMHRLRRQATNPEDADAIGLRRWMNIMQSFKLLLDADMRFTYDITDSREIVVVEGWRVYSTSPPSMCGSCSAACPAAGKQNKPEQSSGTDEEVKE